MRESWFESITSSFDSYVGKQILTPAVTCVTDLSILEEMHVFLAFQPKHHGDVSKRN